MTVAVGVTMSTHETTRDGTRAAANAVVTSRMAERADVVFT